MLTMTPILQWCMNRPSAGNYRREVYLLLGELPVRQALVEEGTSSIVALSAFHPREILRVDTGQPQPGDRKFLLDAQPRGPCF